MKIHRLFPLAAAIFTALMFSSRAGAAAAAADAGGPGYDLLAGPLDSVRPYAWKHFSEDPQTRK